VIGYLATLYQLLYGSQGQTERTVALQKEEEVSTAELQSTNKLSLYTTLINHQL
jgi:hypothetical protein